MSMPIDVCPERFFLRFIDNHSDIACARCETVVGYHIAGSKPCGTCSRSNHNAHYHLLRYNKSQLRLNEQDEPNDRDTEFERGWVSNELA